MDFGFGRRDNEFPEWDFEVYADFIIEVGIDVLGLWGRGFTDLECELSKDAKDGF